MGAATRGPEDHGLHVVCTQVTRAFLDFARKQGNDLCHADAGIRLSRSQALAIAGACAATWRQAY
jgi:uncharacterized protein (DUF2237 family)